MGLAGFQGKGRLIGKVAEVPPATNETAAAMGDLFRSFGSLFARLAGTGREKVTAKTAEVQKEHADRDAKRANDWQAEAALNDALSAAWRQHRNDPVALDKAFGEAKKQWLDAIVVGPPASRTEQLKSYGAIFDLRTIPFRNGARDLTVLRRRGDAETGAAALRSSWNIVTDHARLAANSEDGDGLIAAEVARAGAQIDGMVAAGVLDPVAANAERRRVAGAALAGRAMAEFDKLGDPDRQAAYAARVLESWQSGKGELAQLDEATARRLAADLAAEAAANAQRVADARDAEDSLARFGNPAVAVAGFKLIGAGKLSVDWLDQNRDQLAPVALASFTRALDPTPALSRDPVQRGALARAANNGTLVEDEALSLHAAGLIGTDDLQAVAQLTGGPRPEARQQLDRTLAPSQDAPAIEHEQHWNDTLMLDEWLREHPTADDKAVNAYAERFTAERGAARRASRRSRLPLPAYVPVLQRTAMNEGAVAAARSRTRELGLANVISDADAGRQARLLTAWSDSVEPEVRRG